MIDYSQILALNYPGAQWMMNGTSYDGLDWMDSSPKPTQEELDALWIPTQEVAVKVNCSNTAKQLLANSDWSVLPDVNLANKADFEAYRSTLRGYVLNPVVNPVWPTEPEPIWS